MEEEFNWQSIAIFSSIILFVPCLILFVAYYTISQDEREAENEDDYENKIIHSNVNFISQMIYICVGCFLIIIVQLFGNLSC